MTEKKFIGKVTEKFFSNGDSILKLAISPQDREKLEDGWINLNIQRSKKGTWYATIDDWKPANNNSRPVNGQQAPVSNGADDLPF